MNLGQVSATLVWGATFCYVIALVAFALDLARLTEAAGSLRRENRLAAVGAAGAVAPARGGPGASARPDVPVARGRAVRIAMSLTVLGFVLHAVATVLRGIAAGRVPWANMYEFALVGSLVAVATFLVLCRTRDVRFLGTLVTGIVALALSLSLVMAYVPASPVEPALQSPWLVIHVSVAIAATGLFTVAFCASVLQLLKDSRETRLAGDEATAADGSGPVGEAADGAVGSGLGHRRWRALDLLPRTRDLEALSFRINAVGFVLWTFTLIAGAVWAEDAWGRYWGWDPKEVWTFVVWVVYAAYLHARTTRGWAGRRAAWFVVVGYGTVIFNFTVVNLLIPGQHSYSGL